jgi:hypothetical protein
MYIILKQVLEVMDIRIIECKGYKFVVSDTGRVWYANTMHEIKFQLDKNEYLVFNMGSNGNTSFKVHRLVALAFIPNPYNLPCVNHKDFDTTNNNVNNLEWCSNADNIAYSRKAGRYLSANKSYHKPVYCYETNTVYESVKQAAEILNINRRRISAVCCGYTPSTGGYHFKYINKPNE